MTTELLLAAATSLVLLFVTIAGLVTTAAIEKRISLLEQLVYKLAHQSEDQATLINQQAKLIARITSELRRGGGE